MREMGESGERGEEGVRRWRGGKWRVEVVPMELVKRKDTELLTNP